MRRQTHSILHETFDIDLPPDALIGELSAAQQQLVQITRALLNRPKILVFDEPTAALVRREVDRLFGVIAHLRRQGMTILYISHYLNEIVEICNRVTVLRNGVDVGTVDPRATPVATLVAMMTARDMREMFPRTTRTQGDTLLSVEGLSADQAFENVAFTLRRGEILGLTGLVGSGAKALLRCLFGLQRPDAGRITLDGKPYNPTSPAQAVRAGIALVPEDRRRRGIALSMSVRENAIVASLKRFARGPLMRGKAERDEVDRLIDALGIKTSSQNAALATLSGGNQQKVVLAKWLARQSRLYLLDEPTVGVDVGAKVEIYRLINELAAQGVAILVLSTDLVELVGLCDRILVMHRDRIVHDVAAADSTPDDLLLRSTGAETSRHAA